MSFEAVEAAGGHPRLLVLQPNASPLMARVRDWVFQASVQAVGSLFLDSFCFPKSHP